MTQSCKMYWLLPFFLLAFFSCSIHKPIAKPYDSVFSSVPEEHRASLCKRLEELEKALKEQDWEKYFELLEKKYVLEQPEGLSTKEGFIENLKNSRDDFNEFIPKSATDQGYGYWWIVGCAGYGRKIIKYYEVLIFAKLEDNGEWFFSNCFAPYFTEMNGSPLPCKEE